MFHKKEEKTENAGYPEGKKKRKKLPGWVILPVLGVIAAVFFAVSRLEIQVLRNIFPMINNHWFDSGFYNI